MAKLVDRLKSFKSLKHLVVEHDAREDDCNCLQTPTDPSVAHAEASLSPTSPCSKGPDVIQTPTCSHVVEAEADVAGESPVTSGSRHSSSGGLSSGNGLVSKLARRLTTRRSFHGSYDDFDSIRGGAGRGGTQSVTFQGAPDRTRSRSMGNGSAEGRALQFSHSHPNLSTVASAAGHAPAIHVLGKEARRRSERRRSSAAGSEDGAAAAACMPLPPSPPEVVTRLASDATASGKQALLLYNVVTPLQSPFADTCEVSFTREQRPSIDGAVGGAGTSGVGACQSAAAAMPGQALPPTRSSTERLTLRRKISSCKLIVSTEPLEERPGDIMLSPEVVEFASDALANLGGRYTGEIEFSGRSARVARRMSSSAHIIAPQDVQIPGTVAA